MDDVVALRLHDAEKGLFGAITWGRLWDQSDDAELCQAVKDAAPAWGLEHCESVELCESLSEVSSGKHFYEGLLSFAFKPIPFGDSYDHWREYMRGELAEGREIYLVGALPAK